MHVHLKQLTYAPAPGEPVDVRNLPDLATATIPLSTIAENTTRIISFPPLKDSAGQILYLYLEAPDSTPDHAITAWQSSADTYPQGSVLINHVPAPGDLTLDLFYTKPAGATDAPPPPPALTSTPAPTPPPIPLPSSEFQPLLGSAVAAGDVLRLTRASADQPVSLTAHPLAIQPYKSYLITFEYRALSPSTPPFSVYVEAPDSMTPGRRFAYSSPDVPPTWRSASFTYLPSADPAIAAASRLIVRYDGSGSVEVRRIQITESP